MLTLASEHVNVEYRTQMF